MHRSLRREILSCSAVLLLSLLSPSEDDSEKRLTRHHYGKSNEAEGKAGLSPPLRIQLLHLQNL